MWQTSQILNSEAFIIFNLKEKPNWFYLPLRDLVCQMVESEMSVTSGWSQVLAHCPAVPLLWDPCSFCGEGAGIWSLLVIFQVHQRTCQVSVLSSVCHQCPPGPPRALVRTASPFISPSPSSLHRWPYVKYIGDEDQGARTEALEQSRGWGRVGGRWKWGSRRGDICIPMTNSRWCMAEIKAML